MTVVSMCGLRPPTAALAGEGPKPRLPCVPVVISPIGAAKVGSQQGLDSCRIPRGETLTTSPSASVPAGHHPERHPEGSGDDIPGGTFQATWSSDARAKNLLDPGAPLRNRTVDLLLTIDRQAVPVSVAEALSRPYAGSRERTLATASTRELGFAPRSAPQIYSPAG
jgi:hypothetical protein